MKKRIIYREDGSVYLIRYTLFKCRWFAIRLHHILLSDYDCLHDHPWNFISIILWKGYIEAREKSFKLAPWVRWNTFKRCKPGSILFRKAEDKHRLIVSSPAWTLVIMMKRRREWGFWTKGGWIHWSNYKSTQSCE